MSFYWRWGVLIFCCKRNHYQRNRLSDPNTFSKMGLKLFFQFLAETQGGFISAWQKATSPWWLSVQVLLGEKNVFPAPTVTILSVIPEMIKSYGKLVLAGSLGGNYWQSSLSLLKCKWNIYCWKQVHLPSRPTGQLLPIWGSELALGTLGLVSLPLAAILYWADHEQAVSPLNWPIYLLGWLLAENRPWLAVSAKTCSMGHIPHSVLCPLLSWCKTCLLINRWRKIKQL